jgi:hypothetical protein
VRSEKLIGQWCPPSDLAFHLYDGEATKQAICSALSGGAMDPPKARIKSPLKDFSKNEN